MIQVQQQLVQQNKIAGVERICKKCGKIFYVTERYPSGDFKRPVACPECSKLAETKTLTCERCGKEFIIYRDKHGNFNLLRRFCDVCLHTKEEKQPIKKICEYCGKEFETIKYNRKLCDYCAGPKDFRICTCKRCGKEFKVYKKPGKVGIDPLTYCSPECSKPSTKEIICKYCGKPFLITRGKNGQFSRYKLYCSDECKSKALRENVDYAARQKKIIATNLKKYGVNYPVQLRNPYSKDSKINIDFAELILKDLNFESEFSLENLFYDFCIKDQKILIELNPVSTHNSALKEFTFYPPKDKNYHLCKTNLAEKYNYHCIHVWQWDNWGKIYNLLKSKEKLYARKLQLKEINKQEANNFLDEYHLQNSCYGNLVNLGLFDGEELVQVMTFGKPRYNKNYKWELLRLCSHSDYIIVGGAEKLFKYFVDNYNPNSIISYCDVSKFTGEVYERLGFKLLRQTAPQKIWGKREMKLTDYITDSLLRQRGFDQLFNTNYGKGTNNEQLMLEHGWLPVYDCGQKVFIWEIKDNVN